MWEWHLVNKESPPCGSTQNKVISHYLQPASVWVCPKVEAAVTFPLRSQRENFPRDVTCGASAAQTPLALMEHNRMWNISRALLASRNASTLSKPGACLVWRHRHGTACYWAPTALRNPSFLWPSPPETLPPSLWQASWAAGPLASVMSTPRVNFVYLIAAFTAMDYQELCCHSSPWKFSLTWWFWCRQQLPLQEDIARLPRIKSECRLLPLARISDGPQITLPPKQQQQQERQSIWNSGSQDTRHQAGKEWTLSDGKQMRCALSLSQLAAWRELSSVRWEGGPGRAQQTQNWATGEPGRWQQAEFSG